MSWRKEKLSNICHMKTGKLDSNAAVPDGEFPFFTCAQETYRINIAAYDTEAVLLGGNNAAGIFPLKYYNGPFNAYQRTYILESLDSSKLSTRFLYYALKPALSLFQSASIGAATQYLTKPILENFQISLPSIESQNKIVSILSVYDDLIENNRRRIQLLEEAARLLYQEWFVRLRFPGHEHAKIVDGVPEGWNSVKFPTIVEINPITKVDHGSKIRYIPMSALNEGLMIIKHEDIEVREKPTNVRFKNYDVLFARITPCLENGKTSFVYYLDNNEVACGSTEFIVFRGKMVSPFFVYCLSRTHDFRENAIKSMIGSSGRQRVQNSCFSEYSIMLAPQKILDLFDSTIKPIFKQIEILDRENQNLVKARDLLLPRLMNGVIPV
ncbi:restriction endonuclease subunit S [Methanospirillum sp.]|uniref:restriction endonuclease subunit S n=1 Tax=Methanospirillum sp. TaxID=45200 RepID=UPI001BD4026B|nr:restriction endonuclease subunit S [Methanospirillum sp.]